MHLVIQPDGRTALHGDMGDIRTDIHIHHRTDRMRAQLSLGREDVLPMRCPTDEHGRYTLWVAKWTITEGAGVRNVPAAILGAQWGLTPRLLAGPVAVTHTGSEASAYVSDIRWSYVEELAEDITRAIGGLPICSVIHEPMWPQAVRLADAVLRDAERPMAPKDISDADALAWLMRDLAFGDDTTTTERI